MTFSQTLLVYDGLKVIFQVALIRNYIKCTSVNILQIFPLIIRLGLWGFWEGDHIGNMSFCLIILRLSTVYHSYSQLILLVIFYHSWCAINVTYSCCWPWSLGSGVIFQAFLLWSCYFSPFPYCTLWKKVTVCNTHFWYGKSFCPSFPVEYLPVTWNTSARKHFFLIPYLFIH